MEIIDNFLPKAEFDRIKEIHTDENFAWYFINYVGTLQDINGFYFIHTFFNDNTVKSDYFKECCHPLLNKIGYNKINKLIKIKSNLFTKTHKNIEHAIHRDYEFEHTTGVFTVNTNNGFTQFDDGTKVESIENRMLLFNGSKLHQSVSQTDTKQRINININFIGN